MILRNDTVNAGVSLWGGQPLAGLLMICYLFTTSVRRGKEGLITF